VPYAELSDFYYVWLKRTLSDVKSNVLVPRFYPEAFFECLDDRCSSYIEIRTQWEKYAPLEISVSSGRADFFRKIIGVETGSDEDFREKLRKAFKRMAELTRDDGMIVTYYAHTDPSAWEALVEAGWRKAGLRVSAAYVIATESEQRVTARGKVALDASVVVVWRKGSGGVGFVQEVENKAFEEALRRVDEALKIGLPLDINLFLKSLAGVLSVYTLYSKLVPDISVKEIVKNSFSLALKALVEAVYKRGGVEKPLDPYSSAYVALKLVTRTSEEKAEARRRESKIEFRRGRVDKTFASLLGVFSNINVDILIANKILAKKGDELELLEPEPDSLTEQSIRRALENLLHEKNLDPSKPENFRTAVDALHYLELKAIQLTSDQFRKLFEDLRSRNLRFSEAIDLAKVLHAALPDNDPEKIGCKRILQHLNMISLGGLR
jgi:putative DNA methylase